MELKIRSREILGLIDSVLSLLINPASEPTSRSAPKLELGNSMLRLSILVDSTSDFNDYSYSELRNSRKWGPVDYERSPNNF